MMNTKRIALTLIGVGVLAVGALAVPAIAGVGPFAPNGPAAMAAGGNGPGHGNASDDAMGRGYGPGTGYDGVCPSTSPAAMGTLTTAQQSSLQYMAEEEKLAGDLYQAFADRYPATIFDRIVKAERQHLQAVRVLLTRYQLSDPTAGKPAGQFTSAEMQATYDRLLAEGLTDQTAALRVGKQVELADITAIEQALNGLTAADVKMVYENLLAASEQHLTAFTAWLT